MKVSLISLNLNGAPFLENFLDSAKDEIESFPDSELILLDNGSSDNSVSMVRKNHPWVRLAISPRNLGFAGGTHKAVEDSKAEILIFLNNDMVLEPGFIEEIIKPFESDDDIGAVAGFMLNETGALVDYGGGDVNLFGWGFQRYHSEHLSVVEDVYADRLYPQQFFPCGGAVAIKRDTWIKSGGFDPDYFAFFEDVDLGWRLNIMGLKTVLAMKARVRHKHHGTAAAIPIFLRAYLLERNALMTVIKNYDDDNLGKILPWAVSFANERGLIESNNDAGSIFKGRWADDIFARQQNSSSPAITNDLEMLKNAGIRKAKEILSSDTGGKKYPVRNLAIEYVFENWIRLMETRQKVQSLRKVPDREIIPMMGENYRTVLGHQREKKLMDTFRKYVQI